MVNSGERFDCCYGHDKIQQQDQPVTNEKNSFLVLKSVANWNIHLIIMDYDSESKIWIFVGIIFKNAPVGENLFISLSLY